MSVYRKDSSGKLVKIAGSLTQRWNMLMLPTKHTVQDGADYYEITEAASQYISALTEYTNYSVYLAEPNQTANVYIKYKDKTLQLIGYSTGTVAVNSIFARVNFYTLSFTDVGDYAFLDVDTEVSSFSTNAVSNKAVYDEIEKHILSPGTNMTISQNNIIDTVHSPIFKQIISENTRNTISLDKLNNGVEIDVTGDQWSSITFDNVTSLDGSNVWYTENNVYYSYLTNHYKLVDGQWQPVVFNGLASFTGNNVWRHNGNTYYSAGSNQYVLNETTMTWSQKLWVGLTSFNGSNVWNTNNNIYCSSGTTQYVLNKDTDEWTPKTWIGLTSFSGDYIWTDHVDYYYSSDANTQYKLDEETSTWTLITWNIQVYGSEIWYYDGQIYMSYQDKQYQLDMETMSWVVKDWLGLTEFDGSNVYANGTKYYYGSGTNQYSLDEANSIFKVSADKVTFNGQDITGGGDTTNFVQKGTMPYLTGIISTDNISDYPYTELILKDTSEGSSADQIGFKFIRNASQTPQYPFSIREAKDGTYQQVGMVATAPDYLGGLAMITLDSRASTETQKTNIELVAYAKHEEKAIWNALRLDATGLYFNSKPIYPNSIRFDEEQSLTDAQKTQARTNLGLNDTGAAWGSITGTLSDQTDLQNNFNDINQQLVLVRSNITSINSNITSINNKIPDDASTSNYPVITFAESERQKSKNLLSIIGSNYISINDDGLITLNYTLPLENPDYNFNVLKNNIYLKKGHTYTFSLQNYTNISGVGRQLITCKAKKVSDNTGISDYLYIAINETTKTITPTEDVYLVSCNFYGYYPNESITANFSCYLQIEENAVATDYVHCYGQISRTGDKEIEFAQEQYNKQKNLIPYPYSDGNSKTYNGITFTVNNDQSISVSGAIIDHTTNGIFWLVKDMILNAGTYRISDNGSDNLINVAVWDKTNNLYYQKDINQGIFSILSNATVSIYAQVLKTATKTYNETIKGMLCKGVDTEYQPYQGGEFVQEESITPDLIYDKDTKNIINGTAYTDGIKIGTTIPLNISLYKKLKIYSLRSYDQFISTLDLTSDIPSPCCSTVGMNEEGNYYIFHVFRVYKSNSTLNFLKGGYHYVDNTNYTPRILETADSNNLIYRIEGIK